jgi:uncharacterized protein (DUF58 family)
LAQARQRTATATAPLRSRLGRVLAVVSPLGWTVAVAALVAWLAAWRLGWAEFGYISAVFALLLLLSVGFTIGRLRLGVELNVEPRRVRVGESAGAQLLVTSHGRSPVLPVGVELPVGNAVARYTTPLLRPGAVHEELALIPTSRRGVVPLGPVTTQRGDPFGVFRREVAWTDRIEMFVHPRTVPLESLGSGLIRDLEGRTTNEVSMSDLAFHTLREYVPGDDRRYIHWRSSAKATAAAGQSAFLVRQFLDTRRSHIAVVVDVHPDSYETTDEFELAVSAGASVAVRALADEMDLTVLCGEHAVVQPAPHSALDVFSRAEPAPLTLHQATSRLAGLAPDVSVVLFLTGPLAEFAELRRARSVLAPELGALVIRAQENAPVGLREVRDLPRVLAGGDLG